ncbi:hypothetical protein NKJ26_26445 [Mesorhizobium sp. M0152]|uniref:hypothetical protein n=1 Tax=Mesorhizobium sp. M0152 TaxID=2956898 RepID=UPI003336DD53
MTGYVYMRASRKRGTVYIGVTNDLGRITLSTSPAKAPFHQRVDDEAMRRLAGISRLPELWKSRL